MANRTATIVLTARDLASGKINNLGTAIKAVGGIAAAVGAVQIGRTLVSAIEEAIDLSGKQEAQERKLAAALESTGRYSAELAGKLKGQAAALQKVTAVGDETIIGVQALLVQFGVGSDIVTDLSESVLDLAKTFEIDYQSAARLVAKAIQGNVGALSRYGVTLDSTRVKARGAVEVLEQMQKQLGGRARAEADTYTGSVEKLKNAWGDLKEQIGDVAREISKALIDEALLPAVERAGEAVDKAEAFRRTLYDVAIGAVALAEALEPGVELLTKFAAVTYTLTLGRIDQAAKDIERLADSLKSLPTFNVLPWAAGLSAAFTGVEDLSGETENELSLLEALRAKLVELRDLGPKTGLVPGAKTEVDTSGAAKAGKVLETAFVGPLSRLEEIDALLGEIGQTGFGELEDQADAVELAIERLREAFSKGLISKERFALALELFEEFGQSLRKRGIEVEGLTEKIEVIPREIISQSDAVRIAVEDGIAQLRLLVDAGILRIEDLGTTIDRALREQGVAAATRFGDALVDAAFGADVSWGEFLRGLLKDLIKAVLQAELLDKYLRRAQSGGGFFSSLFGFFGGLFGGGATAAVDPLSLVLSTPRPFASGGIIAGPSGIDQTLIRGTRGELVADTTLSESRAILSGRAAIVPLGAADAGSRSDDAIERAAAALRGTVLDGTRVARWFEVHYRGMVSGLRVARARGEL